MALPIFVDNYKVTFSDGLSRNNRFTRNEIDDWVHESNQLFAAQGQPFKIVRVEDSSGSLAWPLPVRPWSRGREIAMTAAGFAWVALAAYSILLVVIGEWSIILLPFAATYYFYNVALRFQQEKVCAMRDESRRASPQERQKSETE